MKLMEQIPLAGQRILIREDFNVPMKDGRITHTMRIDEALPTIQQAIKSGAKIIVMSHLGRPEEGKFDPQYSLQPVADYLSDRLQQKVCVLGLNDTISPAPGEVVLLENVRFLVGEQDNDPALAQQLAALCDVFVMDAFAVAHRAQASTCGVAQYAPMACAGPLLQKELKAISHILDSYESPVVAIVGGSKVSSKLDLLKHLLNKVDILVVGGGIANTFLAAKGYSVGGSLYEEELIPTAQMLFTQAEKLGKIIWLPDDVVVATQLSSDAQATVKALSQVADNEKILDIGPSSQKDLTQIILNAKTILWNGPVGVFEYAPFAQGTAQLAKAISESQAYSVAGGGDTLAAIEQFKVADKISYLSTGGGAFLEALEGKTLPAVAALMARDPENQKI